MNGVVPNWTCLVGEDVKPSWVLGWPSTWTLRLAREVLRRWPELVPVASAPEAGEYEDATFARCMRRHAKWQAGGTTMRGMRRQACEGAVSSGVLRLRVLASE